MSVCVSKLRGLKKPLFKMRALESVKEVKNDEED